MLLLIFDLINNGKNQIIVTVTSRGFLAKKLMGVFIVRRSNGQFSNKMKCGELIKSQLLPTNNDLC